MSKRLLQIFEHFIGGMNAVGSVWVIGLMVLICADVAGREWFESPVRGVPEMVSLSIVAIVFLQLSHTLWVGRITRNDAFLTGLARRWPAFASFLELVFHVTGSFLFGLLSIESWFYFGKSLRVGEYIGALGDFIFPTWPVWLIIVLGSAVTCIAFGIRALEILPLMRRRRP